MKKEFRYGEKIRQMRKARAWTQEQLAAAANLDTRTVQRVEKDETKSPETLQAIAGAFNVDLESLRSTWLIPDSRLLHTWLVTSHRQFVRIEEAISWNAQTRTIMAPLTEEGEKQVNELLGQIFADRECISPSETELWNCYVEQIEEPLRSLFDLELAIFLLDERRDLLLPSIGMLKPAKPYIDDWRVQHFLVVPRHGCFRLSPIEPLHRFNETCPAAGDALFRAINEQENIGVEVFGNALYAVTPHPPDGTMNWCDSCFPVVEDGLPNRPWLHTAGYRS
jgi:transcriptional regulator with XRE-family HTH domain